MSGSDKNGQEVGQLAWANGDKLNITLLSGTATGGCVSLVVASGKLSAGPCHQHKNVLCEADPEMSVCMPKGKTSNTFE